MVASVPEAVLTSAPGGSVWPELPPRGPPRRRRITQDELSLLTNGDTLKDYEVYVGRGGRGVPASK